MRVLVTGAGGLIGSHLIEALAANSHQIQGWTQRPASHLRSTHAQIVVVDIGDDDSVYRLVRDFVPEIVFHLAAQSSPGASWQDPAKTYAVNVGGTIHLLEAARTLSQPPRLLLAGSSAEYAEPTTAAPLTENAPIDPNSPYAASKAAMTQLGQLYGRRYELDIVVFRPFFLVGPRKIGDVCSDFARRIVSIERGEESEMRIGTLEVVRDLMDVRDGVSALLRLAEAGQRGAIYNVASGRGTRIQSVLDAYISLARVAIRVVQDPALLRPLEQNVKIGDPRKLLALGWRPEHSLTETLKDILNYWRSRPA
jgi:GDP-4-dehydro-6-deoxy-D-mannose reductase